jgi:hypothetical protein
VVQFLLLDTIPLAGAYCLAGLIVHRFPITPIVEQAFFLKTIPLAVAGAHFLA